jgi:hypothetical protein
MVAIMRSREKVDWPEVLTAMFELARGKQKGGDLEGYLATERERLALAVEHADELKYVHLTHVYRDVGLAYHNLTRYEEGLPFLQTAYDRSHAEENPSPPTCRFCPVRRHHRRGSH